MKDLKREITVMAGIVTFALVIVTILGINKVNNLKFSSAAKQKNQHKKNN